MGNLVDAIVIGNLTKRVNAIEELLVTLKPTLQEMVDVIEEDDKRINDLHEIVRSLEKRMEEGKTNGLDAVRQE